MSVACSGNGGGVKDEGIAAVPGESASGHGSVQKAGTGSKGAFFDAQMKYVQCMRGKGGFKTFPDPKLSGHLDWAKIGEIAEKTGNGKVYKGGADRDGAEKGEGCVKEFLAADALAPPRNTQKDYEAMLAHAKCMRENGVSKFTNPTLSGGGVVPGGDPNPVSPQIDPESPAYKQAREACKDKLLDGLDGMQ
ncbi:hypothetical protein [Streptomyces sp. NBC_00829]|uniref:hypothetical protein n=1 Tax=Streptomyces sp. NBC_00829 TaxID=2903679 RepID=UPI00386CE23C